MTEEEDLNENEISELIPQMNVSVPSEVKEETNLISDDQLLGIYSEIIDCIREDRKQVSEFIDNMAEMVINEGDATSSSKEALVNLVKIKTEMADKYAKVADLMTRVKLKEKDTFPKYLAASQNNTINIGNGNSSRRALITAINKAKEKDKNV